MAAANGTYRIFRREAGDYAGQAFTASGESYSGSIASAFDFAQTLQDADPAHVYIPWVDYEVRYGNSTPQQVPSPALSLPGSPIPIVANHVSCTWEQTAAVEQYLADTLGPNSWGLQSYGPG